jgi:hypothetical protein
MSGCETWFLKLKAERIVRCSLTVQDVRGRTSKEVGGNCAMSTLPQIGEGLSMQHAPRSRRKWHDVLVRKLERKRRTERFWCSWENSVEKYLRG